jgi:hypothetical protein
MSEFGRKYVFSVPSATRVQTIRSGKYPLQTGRLVESNINNHLTTGDDPSRQFSILDLMSGMQRKPDINRQVPSDRTAGDTPGCSVFIKRDQYSERPEARALRTANWPGRKHHLDTDSVDLANVNRQGNTMALACRRCKNK